MYFVYKIQDFLYRAIISLLVDWEDEEILRIHGSDYGYRIHKY